MTSNGDSIIIDSQNLSFEEITDKLFRVVLFPDGDVVFEVININGVTDEIYLFEGNSLSGQDIYAIFSMFDGFETKYRKRMPAEITDKLHNTIAGAYEILIKRNFPDFEIYTLVTNVFNTDTEKTVFYLFTHGDYIVKIVGVEFSKKENKLELSSEEYKFNEIKAKFHRFYRLSKLFEYLKEKITSENLEASLNKVNINGLLEIFTGYMLTVAAQKIVENKEENSDG